MDDVYINLSCEKTEGKYLYTISMSVYDYYRELETWDGVHAADTGEEIVILPESDRFSNDEIAGMLYCVSYEYENIPDGVRLPTALYETPGCREINSEISALLLSLESSDDYIEVGYELAQTITDGYTIDKLTVYGATARDGANEELLAITYNTSTGEIVEE